MQAPATDHLSRQLGQVRAGRIGIQQLVLDLAEEKQVKITYQGDLSKWSERVYPILAKKALDK